MNEDNKYYRDGAVVLYKRAKSKVWQCRMKLGKGKGSWHRISTGEIDIQKAGKYACKEYDYKRFRHSEGQTIITKDFTKIAKITIKKLQTKLEDGLKSSMSPVYTAIINNYLIPYFGKMKIDKITHIKLENYDRYRKLKMGRIPAHSTVQKHNTALKMVFDTAVENEWIKQHQVPKFIVTGFVLARKRRPWFSKQEYRQLYLFLKDWHKERGIGISDRTIQMREFLYDYILILANTGIRPGIECYNICWTDISLVWKDKKSFIRIKISGKTGHRTIIARDNTGVFLRNIASRFDDLKHLPDKDLYKIKQKVFRLRDGTVPTNIRRTFGIALERCGLLYDSNSGDKRTLYSLRHSYISWALLDGLPIHLISKQCGNSVGIITKFYDHILPEMQADLLSGWNATAQKKSKK